MNGANQLRLMVSSAFRDSVSHSQLYTNLMNGTSEGDRIRLFVAQRKGLGSNFIPLLKRIKCEARERNFLALQQAATRNLSDELGHGENDPHAVWKSDLFSALDLDFETDNRKYLASVEQSNEILARLANRNHSSLSEAFSAIYTLEYFIPREYIALLRACERVFPDKFCPRRENYRTARNRRYLADHIRHDTQEHFVDLHKAIGSFPLDVVEFTHTVQFLAESRKSLYSEIQSATVSEQLLIACGC